MSTVNKAGFTIIETMLFLAITGVLIVALLAGAGTSIGIQRYRDSVTTFLNTLQNQYNATTDVTNDRSATQSCNASAQVSSTSAQQVGQSDCVILGKYITVNNTDTAISDVVGYQTNTTVYSSDVTQLKSGFNISINPSSTVNDSLEWGSGISAFDNSSNRQSTLAVLILKSPTSGLNYTFTSTTIPSVANIKSLMTAANMQMRRVCIVSNGTISSKLGVNINADATGANDIQIVSNQIQGSTLQC